MASSLQGAEHHNTEQLQEELKGRLSTLLGWAQAEWSRGWMLPEALVNSLRLGFSAKKPPAEEVMAAQGLSSVYMFYLKKKFYCKFCIHKLMFPFAFLFCPLWLLPSLLSCQESAPLCAEMPNSSQKLTRKDTFSHFLSKCLDTFFSVQKTLLLRKGPHWTPSPLSPPSWLTLQQ